MNLLLLHLSDLHIQGFEDPLLSRPKKLVRSLSGLCSELSAVAIVITGDIAYRGLEEEYLAANEFLRSLTAELPNVLPLSTAAGTTPIHVVSVPGNHDCDFSFLSRVRNLVIDDLRLKSLATLPEEMVAECLRVQENYWHFHSLVSQPSPASPDTPSLPQLYSEYALPTPSGNVRFLCLNTSWVSQLREEQGKLFFPAHLIPQRSSDAAVIALLHHPYNWLGDENARAVKKRLEAGADVVLTGHEHDPTRRTLEGEGGERIGYIEGGALQPIEDPDKSYFNAILVDLSALKQKFYSLEWADNLYRVRSPRPTPSGPARVQWESFPINRMRRIGDFNLLPSFADSLEDPGLTLTHPDRAKLKLSDLFVPPDLQQLDLSATSPSSVHRLLPSRDVLSHLTSPGRLVVAGDDQSGKTSLAKRLFHEHLSAGRIPLLITPDHKLSLSGNLVDSLLEIFSSQYEVAASEAYRQLEPSSRALIVDDYDNLRMPHRARSQLFEQLGRFTPHVVCFSHHLASVIEDLFEPQYTFSGDVYQIRPFGHVLRDQLAQKWLLLGRTAHVSTPEFVARLTKIRNTFNTVIGNSFVPAYPVYLLAILQGMETTVPVDTSAASHGYYYELFIRIALAQGRTQEQFDFLATYLSELAYCVFQEDERSLSRESFSDFHERFETEFDLQEPSPALLDLLKRKNILAEDDGEYLFRYPYVYYYFVALYLRDHLSESAVQKVVARLADSLFVSEHANIMLFLAHLTRDQAVLDHMLRAAQSSLAALSPARFEKEVEFLNDLPALARELVYRDRDPEETRTEMLQALDDRGSGALSPSSTDEVGELADLNAAVKTVQILGQILKNFPGSLRAPLKVEIAEACYGITRRALTWGLSLIQENEDLLVESAIEYIRSESSTFEPAKAVEEAQRFPVHLSQLISLTLINLLASSISSSKLVRTFKRVREKDPNPAVLVIDAAVKWQEITGLTVKSTRSVAKMLKGHDFALSLVKYQVLFHLQLFPLSYRAKQSICDSLGISYKAMRETRPRAITQGVRRASSNG